ncbi:MAG: glycosyltransferase, partial [Acidimicrobiales bacterium]
MEVQAPPVAAIVVTCDPGPWLEETLQALGAQDYPNLGVVVVDAASVVDPSSRVAAVLPGARVVRLAVNDGFGASANAGRELAGSATHLVLCHDDVAPDPGALRQMVEEAFRSNAGVVAPKLVAWDRPDRLLQVGMGMDRGGAAVPRVERGELDQEQHDAVRDVFVAPGGLSLVRADLFDALGGFDTAMSLLGEDVDLSWRAQLLGARVVVAPTARVRHLEALTAGRRLVAGVHPGAEADLALTRRHELRAVLKAYRWWNLARELPQLAAVSVIEIVGALVTRRPARAGAVAGAWRWNLRRAGELRRARATLQQGRTVPDGDLRRLQVGGYLRVLARRWARPERLGTDAEPADARPRPAADRSRRPDQVAAVLAWILVLFVMALGSRQLVTGALPQVGQLTPWPGWLTLLHRFASGWRPAGLGGQGPAPLAFALMGLGGAVVGGHMGLLEHAAILGTLPVGALGAWRLARPLDSLWSRIVSMVVYAVVPLPYGALGLGRWEALVAYAAAPWILALLLSGTGLEPFGRRRSRPASSTSPVVATVRRAL